MEHIRQVWPFLARSGALTLKAETGDGKIYFLHSLDDPEAEAEEWLKKIKLRANAAYIIYGFGLGYHVKKILDNLPAGSKIFIIEYSLEESLAKAAWELLTEKDWMRDQRIIYLPIADVRALAGAIVEYMRNESLGEIIVCRHYQTMHLFEEFYAKLEKHLEKEVIELFSFNVTFAIKTGMQLMSNCWRNLPFIAKNIGNAAFKDKFSQIPAIIVSSGPSLDKNVDLLKNYKDKAVIITSGSAVRALMKRNIEPHFAVAIDPHQVSFEEIRDYLTPQINLLATYDANSSVISEHRGHLIFCRGSGADMLAEISGLLPEASIFPRNGSVATTAFEFASYIGADPIIFIGQDMALSEGRSQAAGLREREHYKNDAESEGFLVKGYDGQMVKTNPFFYELRNYLSSRIKISCGQKTIINSTEGGVYLEGAEHMALRETGERYLTKRFDIEKKIKDIYQNFLLPDEKPLLEAVKNISQASRQAIEQFDLFEKQFLQESFFEQEHLIEQYENFFANFRKNSSYSYLKFYLNAVYLFQTLEHRAGCGKDKQIADWRELFAKSKKALRLLNELTIEVLPG